MPQPARTVARHLSNLARPHYVFRPAQAVRRVLSDFQAQPDERRLALPWGAQITCKPKDVIGLGIMRRGVFDLLVCELLLRLADPGETALDVGANVGQMTSLLAHAVGPAGRVIAFEPHPRVFTGLERNGAEWCPPSSPLRLELHRVALSDSDGTATLATDVFGLNEGAPTLEPPPAHRPPTDVHTVRTRRLDTVLDAGTEVGVMKLDVEDHELHVLQGATAALSSGRIRDILFEEHERPPTRVTTLLAAHGYALMRIGESLRGPVAGALADSRVRAGYGEDQSLLATRDPDRALARLGPRGWAVYGLGPAGRIEKGRRAPPFTRTPAAP